MGFWLTAGLGLTLLLVAVGGLPETLSKPQSLAPARVAAGYLGIAGDRIFRSNVLAVAFAFASMSAFFAGSPAVMIGTLGMTSLEYGFYPPIAVSGFIIGGIVTRRLAAAAPPQRLSAIGSSIMLLGAVLLVVPPALGFLDKFAMNAAMVVHVTGLGILLPASIAAALQRFPAQAGAAAALQGFVQMAGGAIGAVAVAGLAPALPDLAFPLTMIVATSLCWLVAMVHIPRQ
jgi:DHA1 family bicyclomycin/chloramphenicol resistance-like MFS transporter